jgi:hypothetical protein
MDRDVILPESGGSPFLRAVPRRPALTWRGAYDNGTAYQPNDAVEYLGSSYICILDSTGNDPTNATYWSLLAAKGDVGETGSPGSNGFDGADGAPGADGADGAQGAFGGAITIEYLFSDTTADSDPGSGNLRLGNSAQNLSDVIRVDPLDVNADDWSTVIADMANALTGQTGFVRIVHKTDFTKWLLLFITQVNPESGYYNLFGTVVASSDANPFANGDAVLLLYDQNGIDGEDGAAGATGATGPVNFLPPGGRLTLTSGTPVTGGVTGGVSGQTIYYTPYLSPHISLWDGSTWVPVVFTETSISASGWSNDQTRDIFGYLSSGVLALESVAWTNDTTRATALAYIDGVLCKSGDKTRLYLGTARRGTTNVHDTLDSRFLFNMYNRADRLCAVDATGTTYNSATIREHNGASHRFRIIVPIEDFNLDIKIIATASSASGTGTVGIGKDSTTTFSGIQAKFSQTAATQATASRFDNPSTGLHFYAILEQGSGAGNLVVSGVGSTGMSCQVRV